MELGIGGAILVVLLLLIRKLLLKGTRLSLSEKPLEEIRVGRNVLILASVFFVLIKKVHPEHGMLLHSQQTEEAQTTS